MMKIIKRRGGRAFYYGEECGEKIVKLINS